MSAPRNPNTAALEALIEAHAIELKLPTVRRQSRKQRSPPWGRDRGSMTMRA
jgi:hypothetical protein